MLVAALATLAISGPANPAEPIYQFKMADIDGKPVPLSKFKGKVMLVVNVASYCGNTPQYEGLERLFEAYKGRGLTVLGFPANEFGAQEPGSNAEIKQFCTSKYKVTFPMFSKIVVKGEGTHPLYSWLVQHSDRPDVEVEWNFAKFLISRDGRVVKRISPRTRVDSPEVMSAIEAELAKKG